MTKKKHSTHRTREAKKAIVLNSTRKGSIPIIVIAGVVAFAAAGGLSLFLFSGGSDPVPTPSISQTSSVNPPHADGLITYAASLFDDGQARHFQFKDTESGTTIAYFILKSADGVIRAAFDACDVCWPEGKGYVQDGTVMICRNCGRRFESVKINDVQGGCNPAPLKRAIDGDQVVIRVDDVKQGRQYFNFAEKV